MPHLESKTKLIMKASVNWYINPYIYNIIRFARVRVYVLIAEVI